MTDRTPPGRRLRVLAIRPPPAPQTLDMRAWILTEPLELEYLETVLAPDHEVILWDGMTDRGDPLSVARRLSPDVVLFTGFVTSVPAIRSWAGSLRSLPKPPRVFVGGPHAEVCPSHFFAPGVDGVFFANPLEGIRECLARVAAGRPWGDIPGAAFPAGPGAPGDWRVNPGPPLDPARLPRPRRSRFEADPGRWRYLWMDRCAVVKTAFGCPDRCAFCFCTEQHQGRYGTRPIPEVLDEIESIRGARTIFLLDDNFLTHPARVLEFARGVVDRGLSKRLSFLCYGTADFVARHPAVMAALREAGLVGVIVGFEFVDDEDLAAVDKRSRVADARECLRVCRDLDLEVFGLFVVDPDWPPERFRRLDRQVREWGIAFATFSTLTVLPGTRLARERGRGDADVPEAGWRYDLLRLHRPPLFLSPWGYYLRLFRLYLGPALDREAFRVLRRRYGLAGSIRATASAVWVGVRFLSALARWGPVPDGREEGR